jgi:hypothetical protein
MKVYIDVVGMENIIFLSAMDMIKSYRQLKDILNDPAGLPLDVAGVSIIHFWIYVDIEDCIKYMEDCSYFHRLAKEKDTSYKHLDGEISDEEWEDICNENKPEPEEG